MFPLEYDLLWLSYNNELQKRCTCKGKQIDGREYRFASVNPLK